LADIILEKFTEQLYTVAKACFVVKIKRMAQMFKYHYDTYNIHQMI